MKAMILDMCILHHKTQCFLMFGHVVDVGAGKRRGLPVYFVYNYTYIYIFIYSFNIQLCTLCNSTLYITDYCIWIYVLVPIVHESCRVSELSRPKGLGGWFGDPADSQQADDGHGHRKNDVDQSWWVSRVVLLIYWKVLYSIYMYIYI